MQFPIHSYGTQNIPEMVSQFGQLLFKKREGERQDKKDLLKLVETRKNTAFDQGYKLLQIYDKYADTAPEAGKKIANQSAQFFKAAGYEFDLSTIADAAEGKKLLQSQTVEKMEQLSEGLFQTGQIDLKGAVNQTDQSTITDQKINILTRFIRQAKQSGVDKEITDIYEKHIAEARKRQAADLAEDRKIKAEERAEGRKTPTGLVGQFQEMHKRMPKNIEELKTFKKNLELPSQRTPVNWTTATKEVSNRFGKQDAMGNIIITPDLQGMNRIAQKKLVELQKVGKAEPLDAVNIAEDFARNVEKRYWEYLDAAQKSREKQKNTQRVTSQFKTKYGYIPKLRPR